MRTVQHSKYAPMLYSLLCLPRTHGRKLTATFVRSPTLINQAPLLVAYKFGIRVANSQYPHGHHKLHWQHVSSMSRPGRMGKVWVAQNIYDMHFLPNTFCLSRVILLWRPFPQSPLRRNSLLVLISTLSSQFSLRSSSFLSYPNDPYFRSFAGGRHDNMHRSCARRISYDPLRQSVSVEASSPSKLCAAQC